MRGNDDAYEGTVDTQIAVEVLCVSAANGFERLMSLQADLNILRVTQAILSCPVTEPIHLEDAEELGHASSKHVLYPEEYWPATAETDEE